MWVVVPGNLETRSHKASEETWSNIRIPFVLRTLPCVYVWTNSLCALLHPVPGFSLKVRSEKTG